MVTRARDGGPFGREIEHTADLGLEVEAPTLELLFERAGLGLLAFMVDLSAVETRAHVDIAVRAASLEELLRDWLQALLVRFHPGGFVAAELDVRTIDGSQVRGVAGGERFDPGRHHVATEVKGVTYHQLAVRRSAAGWWARFIVDV